MLPSQRVSYRFLQECFIFLPDSGPEKMQSKVCMFAFCKVRVEVV